MNKPSAVAEAARFANMEHTTVMAPVRNAVESASAYALNTSEAGSPPKMRIASSSGSDTEDNSNTCAPAPSNLPSTICHDVSGVESNADMVPLRRSSLIAPPHSDAAARGRQTI